MLQKDQIEPYLQARRQLLNAVGDGPIETARGIQRKKDHGWAVDLTFASRKDLSLLDFQSLISGADWALQFTLCHNPAIPLYLLCRLAGLRSTDRVPTRPEDLESLDKHGKRVYEAGLIRFVARAVMRRRLASKPSAT